MSARAKPSPKTKTAPAAKRTQQENPPQPYSTSEINEIFRRFSVQRPEPRSELNYSDAYTLLVAVALSAQATDIGVNKATDGLFRDADTPEKMIALGEEGIADHIRTIGLWRNKAKNVLALSQALIRDFGGEVPQTEAELVTLPGVGRKTANVILSVAFHKPTLAADTHIFRFGNRLKIAPGKTPDEVEKRFLAIIPQRYLRDAHHWLILHGRYICKARKPECSFCIIADLCKADEKTTSVPAPLVEWPPNGPPPALS